jgi:hypothetical protein
VDLGFTEVFSRAPSSSLSHCQHGPTSQEKKRKKMHDFLLSLTYEGRLGQGRALGQPWVAPLPGAVRGLPERRPVTVRGESSMFGVGN